VQDAFAIFKKVISTFKRESSAVHFEMMILFRFIGDGCVKSKEYSNGLGTHQEAFDVVKKAGGEKQRRRLLMIQTYGLWSSSRQCAAAAPTSKARGPRSHQL
jgi:hypothetical protein